MKIQKPVKNRKTISPRVLFEIRSAVEKEATRHDCSMSFVIAVILANAFGIKKQEQYE